MDEGKQTYTATITVQFDAPVNLAEFKYVLESIYEGIKRQYANTGVSDPESEDVMVETILIKGEDGTEHIVGQPV